MKRIALAATVALALACMCAPAAVAQSNTKPTPIPERCTAAAFHSFSAKVWDASNWQREAPKPATIAAERRRLKCAPPGHRAAMQHRWRTDERAFYAERHRCRSGALVEGRVSYFGGGLTASGQMATEPGLALNIDPGSEPGGWDNSTTAAWIASLQRFRVTVAGHTAVLPVIDAGPASWTGRSIDITEAGVGVLGLSPFGFPTDSIGRAKLIPPRC